MRDAERLGNAGRHSPWSNHPHHPAMDYHSPAPTYAVPSQNVVSLELPLRVQNFDDAFTALGGEPQLQHVLENRVGDGQVKQKTEPVAGVSLKPDDPFAKKLSSMGLSTRNVLVKVTLPKCTVRKRKRGTDDVFTVCESASGDIRAQDFVRRLQNRPNAYKYQAVAIIPETHRFRSLPDFQQRCDDMEIMQKVSQHLLEPTYASAKSFKVDLSPGATKATTFPLPPTLTAISVPHRYEYRQAHDVVYRYDEQGNPIAENSHKVQKRLVLPVPADIEIVPQCRAAGLRSHRQDTEQLERCIEQLERLMQERPLVTQRVATNALDEFSKSMVLEASEWVGYTFSSGPFRDTLIKYGVDPRSDPKYRTYQALMFQTKGKDRAFLSAGKIKVSERSPTSHIFDGVHVGVDGKTWQVCDITDPVLRDLFHSSQVLSECDVYQLGWYPISTLSKARIIMKDKIRHITAGTVPTVRDYHLVLAATEDIMDRGVAHLVDNVSQEDVHASNLVRKLLTNMKTYRYGNPQNWTKHKTGQTDAELADIDDLDEPMDEMDESSQADDSSQYSAAEE
ncbi:hypothetical protein K470DRAFT_254205 [Piedraia hortae CBS 480.64]|uniref:Transcription factor IIIC subunit Tfc1/Sfc1 triple barrel domain-containing protein n=1 Tax=Piedraia hortae CBS 480.64 TaxID=1314780 RepID=A0A6A7CAX8_9PEZI|nr:hypothetical protein K470DRAFT_254205 [Piedraia hortae CBS 480.64]